jgi:hypothetical protein
VLVLLDTARPVKFWDAPGRRALGEVVLRKPAGAPPTLGWPVYCTDDRGKSTVHCISPDGRWAVGDGCAWDLRPCLDALSAGGPLEAPRPILLPGEEGEIWYPATLAGERLLRVRQGVGEVWSLASERLVGRFAVGPSLPWVSLLAGGRAYTSPKDRRLTVTDVATGHRLAALPARPDRAILDDRWRRVGPVHVGRLLDDGGGFLPGRDAGRRTIRLGPDLGRGCLSGVPVDRGGRLVRFSAAWLIVVGGASLTRPAVPSRLFLSLMIPH